MTKPTKMIAICGKTGDEPYIYGIELRSEDEGKRGDLLFQFKGCRDFMLSGCLRRAPSAKTHLAYTLQPDKTKKYEDSFTPEEKRAPCLDKKCIDKYAFAQS